MPWHEPCYEQCAHLNSAQRLADALPRVFVSPAVCLHGSHASVPICETFSKMSALMLHEEAHVLRALRMKLCTHDSKQNSHLACVKQQAAVTRISYLARATECISYLARATECGPASCHQGLFATCLRASSRASAVTIRARCIMIPTAGACPVGTTPGRRTVQRISSLRNAAPYAECGPSRQQFDNDTQSFEAIMPSQVEADLGMSMLCTFAQIIVNNVMLLRDTLQRYGNRRSRSRTQVHGCWYLNIDVGDLESADSEIVRRRSNGWKIHVEQQIFLLDKRQMSRQI
jgi:hypothetical protein